MTHSLLAAGAGSSPLTKILPGLMIWTIVCFLITLFVLKRWAFGPIQTMLDARRERIRQAIEEAERSREEAQRLIEEHRSLIGQARRQSEEILGEARRVAESQRERVKEETEAERQRRLEDIQRQIQAETQRALGDIRAAVAELSLVAASKVTGKVLTGDDHRRLIDDAIRELDFSVLERERV